MNSTQFVEAIQKVCPRILTSIGYNMFFNRENVQVTAYRSSTNHGVVRLIRGPQIIDDYRYDTEEEAQAVAVQIQMLLASI